MTNLSISSRSTVDWSARSRATVMVSYDASLISGEESENMPIFVDTSPEPLDASSTFLTITSFAVGQ